MNWQPIETAPQDGTPLWLFVDKTRFGKRLLLGWWDTSYIDEDQPSWTILRKDGSVDFLLDAYGQIPTHWMPLPFPPEAP
jgi:hypothetical protein